MTNGGEEKSKKGSKLRAKLTQDGNKEASQTVVQKSEEPVTAPVKKSHAGSGNHKKNQSKVFDVSIAPLAN